MQERRRIVSLENDTSSNEMSAGIILANARTTQLAMAKGKGNGNMNANININNVASNNDSNGHNTSMGALAGAASSDRMALMAALAMTELAECRPIDTSQRKRTNTDDNTNTGANANASNGERKRARSNASDDIKTATCKKQRPLPSSPADYELAVISKSCSSMSNTLSPTNSTSSRSSSSTCDENALPADASFPMQMAVKSATERKIKGLYQVSLSRNKLPKSLSFRKICSKCGKARYEHGELGFGNKCVFNECGKCGAGVECHEKVGVRMGFYCSLTGNESAFVKPGKAEKYIKYIHDLATMATLKKDLAVSQQSNGRQQEVKNTNVDAIA